MTAQDRVLTNLLRLRFGVIEPGEAVEALKVEERVEYARFNRQNATDVHTRLHLAIKRVHEGTLDCMTAEHIIHRYPALWA